MTPTVIQIIAWGAQAVKAVIDIITAAVAAAQAGTPPSLDALDKRLIDVQAGRAAERAAEAAAATAEADAALAAAAQAEFDAELKRVVEPKKP